MFDAKFFKDPIHGQIRYGGVALSRGFGENPPGDEQLGWLIRKLVETREFQRLRHIRQNGLTNLVFHGAEHSRFSHSMGVAHLAKRMYDKISSNMGVAADPRERMATCAAALLHDVGHGPFSHTIEETIKSINKAYQDHNKEFDHEVMTSRIIIEQGSEVNEVLRSVDEEFPLEVARYISKERREADKWSYRLVSSQLDADRIDYLLRDSTFVGLNSHGFDLERLLDLLGFVEFDGKFGIAIHERAVTAFESYILFLDQMYRAVYYHKAVRAATVMLNAILLRAYTCFKAGGELAAKTFPQTASGSHSYIQTLFDSGDEILLEVYNRLTEHQVWTAIDEWKEHPDPVLSTLARRLVSRDLFKTININLADGSKNSEKYELAVDLVEKHFTGVVKTRAEAKMFVVWDEPSRVSYRRYLSGKDAEAIWLIRRDGSRTKIEDSNSSKVISAVIDANYFHRLIFPEEIMDEFTSEAQRRHIL